MYKRQHVYCSLRPPSRGRDPTSNGRGLEKRRGWEIEGTACSLVNLWRGLAGFGRLGGELFAGAEGGWTPVSVGCVQHVYCVESGDDCQ